MRFIGPFFLTITFACGSAIQKSLPILPRSCPDNSCWMQCYDSPDTIFDELRQAHNNIIQLANNIRNLGSFSKGTAYLLDGAYGGNYQLDQESYKLQLNLASIIAIIRQAGSQCHPFCPIKYFNYGAIYPHGQNVPCLDKCQASAFFQNSFSKKLFYQSFWPFYGGTWNSMGQYLADHCFQTEQCASSGDKPLLLFFPGDNNFAKGLNYCRNDSNPHYECAVVEIKSEHSDPHYRPEWSRSSHVYQIKLDLHHVIAAERLLKCMNENCCSGSSGGGPPADNYNVAILGDNRQPEVVVKARTQEEIVQFVESAPRPGYSGES